MGYPSTVMSQPPLSRWRHQRAFVECSGLRRRSRRRSPGGHAHRDSRREFGFTGRRVNVRQRRVAANLLVALDECPRECAPLILLRANCRALEPPPPHEGVPLAVAPFPLRCGPAVPRAELDDAPARKRSAPESDDLNIRWTLCHRGADPATLRVQRGRRDHDVLD